MRVALAQVNPTVGDIAANAQRIVDTLARAADRGATLVVFPELATVGYPPKDLLLRPSFVDDNLDALAGIAATVPAGVEVVVGYADKNPSATGRSLYNAAAVLEGGKVRSRHLKTLLPTYDVFDEGRYFEPGPKSTPNEVIAIGGRPVGLTVCEDLWNDERLMPRKLYHADPVGEIVGRGARLLVNCSASPFVVDKHAFRRDLFDGLCKKHNVPLIYVNQVGGNDELVFDGNSMVIDAEGNVVAQAKDFEEDLLLVDLDAPGDARTETPRAGIASIHAALVLGVRDYVRKCGFRHVLLGLSGGIDSAVVAALAVEALGADKVLGVGMPSRYSSGGSVSDAKLLADQLGVRFEVIPIEPMHAAYERALGAMFVGRDADVTEENLQARTRGSLLMAVSNKFGGLLLTTGNKSELAVGYCTLYGDMCGGLAVISDLPKTMVYDLARFINERAGREVIPRDTITKPPSAELRPDQKDQDSLPPYDVLDAILHRYVELEQGPEEIVASGAFDEAIVTRVVKLIDRSEYKRRQAAPGLKVTSRAFGFGRRMPIAQNYRPLGPRVPSFTPNREHA